MQPGMRDAARASADGPKGGHSQPKDALSGLDPAAIDAALRAALAEDLGPGDLTSELCVPAEARARARLVAKAEGRLAGLDFFRRAFELLDPGVSVELLAQDGLRVRPGQELARLAGRARALLGAERTALNFLQHLSGIASHTARFVERVAGRARVLDTRKTTPGWRAFEKYAVRCGGGENHRVGLFDQVLVKENHIALSGLPLAGLVAEVARRRPAAVLLVVEARDRAEALAVVEGGADVVLLDNFSPAELVELCPLLRQAAGGVKIEIEASGGIDLGNVEAFAASGVDRLSVGSLTHSAPALDLSLYLEPSS